MGWARIMDEWPNEEELQKNRSELIAAISDGSLTSMDGVMSAQTRELIRQFGAKGVDMSSLWAMTPQDWQCPACGRGKRDIVRTNKNNHLICRLVEHHDHMKELLKRRFEEISSSLSVVVADQTSEDFAKRSSSMVSAFDNTIICDDCNVADINAKKAAGANKWFSFSPNELSEIILPRSNQPHRIDPEAARNHWDRNKKTFDLRLKIVDRIAHIAATDTHWFQPINFNFRPQVIENRANSIIGRRRAYGVMDLLTGSKSQEAPKDYSTWRKKRYPAPREFPTPGQIEHVAKVKASKQWDSVSENWTCPGCRRNKNQIVKVTKKNGWSFSLAPRWYRDPATPRKVRYYTLCSDCGFVAEHLGREARSIAGNPNGPLSCLVEVQEIARVVLPSSNARHNIDNRAADDVVQAIAGRLAEGEECGWALFNDEIDS